MAQRTYVRFGSAPVFVEKVGPRGARTEFTVRSASGRVLARLEPTSAALAEWHQEAGCPLWSFGRPPA